MSEFLSQAQFDHAYNVKVFTLEQGYGTPTMLRDLGMRVTKPPTDKIESSLRVSEFSLFIPYWVWTDTNKQNVKT